MKLLIGIVTYNSRKTIDRCLESLILALQDIEYEIIVYDNASSDDTPGFLAEHHSNVKVIAGSENKGYAFGVNRIAESTIWEFILILNPDLYVNQNAVHIALDFAMSNPDAGLIGAKLVDNKKESVHSYGDLPTPDSFAFDFSGMRRLLTGSKSNSYKIVKDETEPFEVGFVTGAFMLIPRDAWEIVDSMDEDFFLFFEDTDLAYRLKEHGKKAFVHPKVIAVHESGASFEDNEESVKYKLTCYFESAYHYFRKHFGNDAAKRTYIRMIKTAESKIKLLKVTGKAGKNALSRQKLILQIHKELEG